MYIYKRFYFFHGISSRLKKCTKKRACLQTRSFFVPGFCFVKSLSALIYFNPVNYFTTILTFTDFLPYLIVAVVFPFLSPFTLYVI